jgi:hypothetical protein
MQVLGKIERCQLRFGFNAGFMQPIIYQVELYRSTFMADFTSTSIPPPKDWQAFERKARLLFELSLGDPATQNNGRSGQPQHGVDIFGKRGGPVGHYVGVQCKGKDIDYGKPVTERELRDEVETSKGFVPDIREFILITTAPDDAKIQQSARLLEAEVRANGRDLSVAVWGWGRLQQEIGRFADAIREFHPDGSPFSGEILGATGDLKKLVQEQGDSQSFTAAAKSSGGVASDRKSSSKAGPRILHVAKRS